MLIMLGHGASDTTLTWAGRSAMAPEGHWSMAGTADKGSRELAWMMVRSLTVEQAKVGAYVTQGATVTRAAKQAWVSPAEVENWLATAPDFKAILDEAQRLRAKRAEDELLELSAAARGALRQILQDPLADANVRHKAALALLGWPRAPEPDPPVEPALVPADSSG